MEQVTVWRCSDGATFESEVEAQAHQREVDLADKVDRFLAAREWSRGEETRARRILTDFVSWRDT